MIDKKSDLSAFAVATAEVLHRVIHRRFARGGKQPAWPSASALLAPVLPRACRAGYSAGLIRRSFDYLTTAHER